jgi:hypothetical protein
VFSWQASNVGYWSEPQNLEVSKIANTRFPSPDEVRSHFDVQRRGPQELSSLQVSLLDYKRVYLSLLPEQTQRSLGDEKGSLKLTALYWFSYIFISLST